jgi:hypothetical protein
MSRLESVETIDRINTYSKYYKKLQRYTKLLYKIEALEKVTEFEAYIVSLSSDSNQIRVYVSSLEIEIDIKVINKKFSQIIENISENENELVIINTQTANGITLSLFQKITIQIVLTSNLLIPITTTIINPNIQEILNLV